MFCLHRAVTKDFILNNLLDCRFNSNTISDYSVGMKKDVLPRHSRVIIYRIFESDLYHLVH